MNKYFGDIEDVKFGQFTASARPLFRASRPGHEKTGISIKFKYHPNQKASSLICGHVLKWILTGIFYGFLNIYKILRILREQDIVKFQRPKITSDTWFQIERDIPHQKAISKLSKYVFKTLGNIWNEFLGTQNSRHTWVQFDLSDLTVMRFGTTQISSPTNVSAKIPVRLI